MRTRPRIVRAAERETHCRARIGTMNLELKAMSVAGFSGQREERDLRDG